MRNITKILILVVVAFAVYLLWPRKPDLKMFKPAELAGLRIKDWESEKTGGGALMTRFKIYNTEYGFGPVTAYRLAKTDDGVLEAIAAAKKPDASSSEESRALSGLREKYTMLKDAVKEDIDPGVLANEEFGWRMSEQDLVANPEANVASTCKILAALYGGQPDDFTAAAADISRARAIILTGQGNRTEALNLAREGYELLHEIAMTPPAGSAQP